MVGQVARILGIGFRYLITNWSIAMLIAVAFIALLCSIYIIHKLRKQNSSSRTRSGNSSNLDQIVLTHLQSKKLIPPQAEHEAVVIEIAASHTCQLEMRLVMLILIFYATPLKCQNNSVPSAMSSHNYEIADKSELCQLRYTTCDKISKEMGGPILSSKLALEYCVWCADFDNNRAIHEDDRCEKKLKTTCPPIIANMTIQPAQNGIELNVYGSGFYTVSQQLYVDVCGELCYRKYWFSDRIQCTLSRDEIADCDIISISGNIGDHKNYSMIVQKEKYICVDDHEDAPLRDSNSVDAIQFPNDALSSSFTLLFTEDHIFVYEIEKEYVYNGSRVAELNIPSADLLDVKLVPSRKLVYCGASECKICTWAPLLENEERCIKIAPYGDEPIIANITSANIVNNQNISITLRLVHNDGETTFFLYKLQEQIANAPLEYISHYTIARRNESVRSVILHTFAEEEYAYFVEELSEVRTIATCGFTYSNIMLTRVDLSSETGRAHRFKTVELICNARGDAKAQYRTGLLRYNILYINIDEHYLSIRIHFYGNGTVFQFNIVDIDQQLHNSKTNYPAIKGTPVARYSSLPGVVLKLTSVYELWIKRLYLTTTNGTFWVLLDDIYFSETQERQIPIQFRFPQDHSALPKYIGDHSTYTVINGSSISRHRLECGGFFDTCDASKAVKQPATYCVWCVDTNSFAQDDINYKCDMKLRESCPPSISNIQSFQNYTQWILKGVNLHTFDVAELSICDEQCKIANKTAQQISCMMGEGLIRNKSCEVSLIGSIEKQNYSLSMTEHLVFGNMTTWEKPDSKISTSIAIVVAIGVVLIVMLLIYISITDKGEYGPISGEIDLFQRDVYKNLYTEMSDDVKIDKARLHMGEKIGEGNFGVVYLSTYKPGEGENMSVACKMIKKSGAEDFFREGRTMKKFHHTKVVQFIGMSLDEHDRPMIVTEFMANGDLQKYLEISGKTTTTAGLLHFAVQIAEGMEYLHDQNFIHRDLAARNCMLNNTLQLKIADFGLARQCNDDKKYTQNTLPLLRPALPVAWTAIEILMDISAQFTLQADVWSYGVVLWEIFSQGNRPYGELQAELIVDFLLAGNRLERPHGCPEQLILKTFFLFFVYFIIIKYTEIMQPSWSVELNEREDFSRLVPLITQIWQRASYPL